MCDDSFAAKMFWEAVIHIRSSCRAFVHVVMENQGLQQLEIGGKMIWNEKVEISKIREFADDWMGSIDNVWPVTRELYMAEVFLVKKQVSNDCSFDVFRLRSRKGLKNDTLANFDTKFAELSPGWTESRQAV